MIQSMKTYSMKASEIQKDWLLVDAQDLVLGRLASFIACCLRGKHKPTYTPHMDGGDHVVVINADKIHLTGHKLDDKVFHWHTGHPGGIKQRTARQTLESRYSDRLLKKAVERMITRSPLGRLQMTHLHIYAGSSHPHAGQKPQVIDFGARNPKNKKRS